MPRVALDLSRARLVAEHEDVRRRAVDQPERDAGVRRMGERALALDEKKLAAATTAFDHELLSGACEEVGDDGIHGDPPACDHDPGLAGRDEDGSVALAAGFEIELERDRFLADRAVGAD